MSMQEEEGQSFIDEMGPPPRFSRFPAPFIFPNKPVAMVPDLSLIMSNGSLNTTQTPASASMLSNNNTSTKSNAPSSHTALSLDDMKKELKELPISLGRIEAKMDKILEIQKEIFEKLSRHKMSMENSTSKDDKPHFSPMTSGYDEHKHFQRLNLERSSTSSSDADDEDDDSPNLAPTKTFYNNVLGNVNRLLGDLPQGNAVVKKRKSSRKENSDFSGYSGNASDQILTRYGMGSKNASIATKDYLQRHGLVSDEHGNTNQPSNSNEDRILNMTAIRNQPKFL